MSVNKLEDFIPLSNSKKTKYLKNKNDNLRVNIFGDYRLYDRVVEALKNGIDGVDFIVDYLLNNFPEYRRKKRQIMNQNVQLCLNKVHDNCIDNEGYFFEPKQMNYESLDSKKNSKNHVNNTLLNLYATNNTESSLKNNSQNYQLNKSKPFSKKKKMKTEKNIVSSVDQEINSLLTKQTKLKEKYLVEPKISFSDFGGIDSIIQEIKKLLFHLRNDQLYQELGVDPPRGFLLHGPPGVGKSLLVEALAFELKVHYLKCAATEIIAGVSGESEEKIRELFSLAKSLRPCLLFIDEIDAITPKRENAAREMERRIVTQLISCLDNLSSSDSSGNGIMVIGATNRLDALDPALRRAGRFDREIALGIPDERARVEILKVLFRKIKVENNFDFFSLAHRTPGYVGADLKNLIREAAILALERFMQMNETNHQTLLDIDQVNANLIELIKSSNQQQLFRIQMSDFDQALKRIQPSAKREGFATVPDVTWNDVGALMSIRQELQTSILALVHYSEDVEKLGLSLSVGILLCGPPGCGKTLLAKAIANESGINFISVKGPELLNMYVGESERAVRSVFNRARNSKPCVIFFDEIDALCPKRTDSDSSSVTSRVVNQLLTEMDGLESRNCFLLAATNRPDILDPAILRPGRFDKILYVGLPSAQDRYEILWTLTKNGSKPCISEKFDLKNFSINQLSGFTGADLSALVRESSLVALRQRINGEIAKDQDIILNENHFKTALTKVKPSVSVHDRQRYEDMYSVYSQT